MSEVGGGSGAVEGSPFELVSRRLGALPLVSHFLARAGVPGLLARYLPAEDARYRLAPATAIGLVVRNLLAGREPLYGLGEWAARYEPAALGLARGDVEQINDDRVGRALERLFDADRASLLTELILGVITEFGVDTAELHNDSTSVSVSGVYRSATGTPRGGKPTPVLTCRVGPPHYCGDPPSEPCLPLVAAHGSSSPRGRAGVCLAGPCCAVRCLVASGAVGVYEAVCRPAAVFGDGLAGHRLSDGRVPGFPLMEGVG